MISSPLASMHIHCSTLTYYSRSKEQLQERLRLKKSVISLSAMIRASDSPLGPHLESDLAIDIYSCSTLIASTDESDHRIIINLLNKSTISLSAAIGASSSHLRSRQERDLAIDLHSGSTLIAIKDESNHHIRFRRL
jgi:hypothetical protein